jgi:hypothetical protein
MYETFEKNALLGQKLTSCGYSRKRNLSLMSLRGISVARYEDNIH